MRHTIWERSTQIEQPGSPEIYSEKGSSLMSNWKMVTGGPVALISLDGILILRLWAIHPSLLSDLRESRVICGTRSARFPLLSRRNYFFHRFGLIQQSASCWQGRGVMVIVIDLCWINCRAQKQCQPLFADYWQSQLRKSATSQLTSAHSHTSDEFFQFDSMLQPVFYYLVPGLNLHLPSEETLTPHPLQIVLKCLFLSSIFTFSIVAGIIPGRRF